MPSTPNHRHRHRLRPRGLTWLVAIVAMFLVCTPAVGFAQVPDASTAGVRFVHGLRGVVADVYLDGSVVLQTFQPERSTDLFAIAPGDHTVDVRLAGADPAAPPMLSGTLTVAAGQNWSAVLHLSADGRPALSEFADDDSPVAPGQTRVVVRHTAAAPAIDVRLGDVSVASGLTNPGEATNQVAAGTYQVSVTPAGAAQALAPVQDVPLQEGTANDMYLVGDQAAGTIGWIAVQTSGLESAPVKVQTGNSGLAATSPPDGAGPFVVLGSVVALAAIALILKAIRRTAHR